MSENDDIASANWKFIADSSRIPSQDMCEHGPPAGVIWAAGNYEDLSSGDHSNFLLRYFFLGKCVEQPHIAIHAVEQRCKHSEK